MLRRRDIGPVLPWRLSLLVKTGMDLAVQMVVRWVGVAASLGGIAPRRTRSPQFHGLVPDLVGVSGL